MDIFQSLGSKLFNGAGIGGAKQLYCKSCNDYTEHIQISYADTDFNDSNVKNPQTASEKAHDIGMRLIDYIPILPSVIGGNPFICKKCGGERLEGGIISGVANKNL
ncbi:MAG: hypothetical protein ACKV1O_14825 [Saprospiraceae bacterium]